MRRKPSHSVRSVAFATVFCALGVAGGCGRVEFNLLPNESVGNAGSAPSNGAGVGNGSLGGNGGSSGRTPSGGAGRGEFGGYGGRFVFPAGGSGTSPCLGEGGCPDDPFPCPDGDPFCTNCTKNNQCALMIADTCDQELKRCVQCRKDFECNGPGGGIEYRCNQKTYRCAKSCSTSKDTCGNDPQQHLTCNQDLGVCVSCLKNDDCIGYGPNSRCYLNECVECSQNSQCGNQLCVFGRCVQPHQ